MFQTGYVLSWRSDLVWFLTFPFLAVIAALAGERCLPAVASASIGLWITAPHHFSTFLRAYGFSDEWQRWRDRLLIAPVLIFAVTLTGLKFAPLTTLLLIMLWDHQHSLMQQYGFARIYDFKARTGAPSTGRFDLTLSWVLYSNLFLTSPFFTEAWVRELYRWQIQITPFAVKTVHMISWTATLTFGIVYVGHLSWCLLRGYRLNPIKYLFFFASYFLWYFVSWQTASFITWSIAHRLMHGVQYMVIVYWYIRRKVAQTGQTRGVLASVARPGNLKAFLLLGLMYAVVYNFITGDGLDSFGFGILNFTIPYDSVPELGIAAMSSQARYDLFAASAISAVAVVHFYFDSFIWKVRDKGVQVGL